MKIEELDSNFARERYDEPDLIFYSALEAPFKIYGVFHDGTCYRRMPEDVAESVSVNVGVLSRNTSGGRVRFATDSPYVAIKCLMSEVNDMYHMPRCGVHGFSLYVDNVFYGVFNTDETAVIRANGGYSGIIKFADRRLREITLYMPLYNSLDMLYIGLSASAEVAAPAPYSHTRPLLFYGSSITQGGCASRPGNSYDAVVARMLDSDFINLGFSGNCKGEQAMAEYISGIDCSVFICDYDHNADTSEMLESTHYNLYRTFRAAQPLTPVVFMSRPDYNKTRPMDVRNRLIVRDTYSKALSSNDCNVYFIDGAALFGRRNRDCCTVDGCHPDDLGFSRMAEKVYGVLSRLI